MTFFQFRIFIGITDQKRIVVFYKKDIQRPYNPREELIRYVRYDNPYAVTAAGSKANGIDIRTKSALLNRPKNLFLCLL